MKRWQPMLFVPILVLSGCASSSGKIADMPLARADVVCVNVRNINSFDSIDDEHLYVKVQGEPRHLLFTMDNTCFGLDNALAIVVKDRYTRVCSDTFGEVIYRDLGRGLESCRILNIEAVASKDNAKQLAELRNAQQ